MPPHASRYLALASLLVLGSCVRPDSPTQVDGPVAFPLYISPALIPSPANAGAAPINRIRARATRVEDAVVVGETVVDVSPDAPEWQIDLEVMATRDPTDVRVFVSLLNASGDAESVEFSGMAGPLTVRAGETVEPADIDLVRGPIDNLLVTGLAIESGPDTLHEGASATVVTAVSTSAEADPTVYLTPLDSSIVSAAGSSVTGLLPGTGRFAASAGAFADTASVFVIPAPATIDVSPDSTSVAAPGEQAAFTAVVLDARGDTLRGEAVTWRTPTPAVVTSLGEGVFEAVAAGTGQVEAASVTHPTVVGSATMVVEGDARPPLSELPIVTITAPADSSVFDPGELATFQATATDAEDGDVGASIQWASSLDGPLATGAAFETQQLSTGVHTISATATDSHGGIGADSITVTVALYTVPATLNVPFGSTASLPITLSEPAPSGGVTLSVASSDETVTRPTSSSVFIPGGSQSANATLEGLVPGTANVSVSSAQFGVVTSVVSVTAQLNILSSSVRFPSTFTQDVTIRLESQGSALAAPAGGLPVSFTSNDPTCVPAPAQITIPEGLISATTTLRYGGEATLPCATSVFADAPDVETDSVAVTVDPAPQVTVFSQTVGSGLQTTTSVSLGATLPAGDTLTIVSSDPSVLLAPDGSTVGADTLKLAGPFGSRTFWIQALEGFTGQATLTVTAPGFTEGSGTTTVVQPGLQIVGLAASTTTLSANDDFYVRTGPTNANGAFVTVQAVRAGAQPLTVTLTSSDSTVATLATPDASGRLLTVDVQPGSSNTPTSFAAGGVSFDPLAAGSTTVRASAGAYLSTNTVTVAVSPPQITLFNHTVGSGLQTATSVSLQAPLPAGDTLTITSSIPDVLLAPDAQTPGSTTLRLVGPFSSRTFWVQAIEGFTGPVVLTATAPAFADGSGTTTVVQPGLQIVGLATSTTTLSAADEFYVRTGTTNANGSFIAVQAVRAGGPPLGVSVTSSLPTVATLVTQEVSGGTVAVEVAPGSSNTPTSLGAGGVALDPLEAGSTTVRVVADGYLSTNSVTVAVSAPRITLFNQTVGSGLQTTTSVSLEATLPFGDTLTITSSSPNVLLAPDASTVGSTTLELAGPVSSRTFYVQAIEGFTGQATLTATAPAFSQGSSTTTVVQPGLQIVGLATGTTTLSANDDFYARTGTTNANGGFVAVQAVRAGAKPLAVTFTSSAAAVASLLTEQTSGASVGLEISAGSSNTPTSFSFGGVALDPLTEGSTTVSVASTGYLSTNSVPVTVSAPRITLFAQTVGSGLQTTIAASLEATLPDGETLTVVSSSPNVLLAADAQTTGSTTLELVGPFTSRSFYVQALEGFTGEVTLTASAPGFTDGSGVVTVTQPGLQIVGLSTSNTVAGATDEFYVRTGWLNANGDFSVVQAVRAGGAPVEVTLTSSDAAVATLVTADGPSATVTLGVPAGSSNTATSVATGGAALDPLAAGSTTVSATASGFVVSPQSTVAVTINP